MLLKKSENKVINVTLLMRGVVKIFKFEAALIIIFYKSLRINLTAFCFQCSNLGYET